MPVSTSHVDGRQARKAATCWVVVAYLCAIAAAVATAALLPELDLLWRTLAADVVGTLVVFAFSRGFANSSFYDAYWSVGPMVLSAFWAWRGLAAGAVDEVRVALALVLVWAWGMRLTFNWWRQWRGLSHEDWRYVDLRAKTGRAFFGVDLAGIHLFPTLQVFAGCLPLHPALVSSDAPFGVLDALALLSGAVAVFIEARADRELHEFAKVKQPGEVLRRGLWRYSRHPNYFGEILFWWSLALLGWSAAPHWWVGLGALSITVMFVVVSLPLIEKRSFERRPDYPRYAEEVSLLIPWPPRSR